MVKGSRRKVKVRDICPSSHVIGDVKQCFVGVSMSNNIFRKKNIIEVLKWIDQNFDSVEIIIADTLHRYNEMAISSITEQEALIKTQKIGDEYFEMVKGLQSIMKSCEIKITRWNDYRNKKQLKSWKTYYWNQFQENDIFHQELILTANNYFQRAFPKNDVIITDAMINLSVNYLLEEFAFISYYIQDTIKVSVYPGKQLDLLKNIVKGNFPKIHSPLLNGIYIDLNIKKIK